MPRITNHPRLGDMEKLLATPANRSKSLSQQQGAGVSGQVPGAPTVNPTLVGTQSGIIQAYGSGTGTGQWMVSGVGHASLNDNGDPVEIRGQLLVLYQGNVFHEGGGVVHLDNNGNVWALHRSDRPGQPLSFIKENVHTSDYVLQHTDTASVVVADSSESVSFTVPFNSGAATDIPVGAWIELFQAGTGIMGVIAGTYEGGFGIGIEEVTLLSDGDKTHARAQYSTIGLRQRANNVWVVTGDLG